MRGVVVVVAFLVLCGFMARAAVRWMSPEPLRGVLYEEVLDEQGDPILHSLTVTRAGCSDEALSLSVRETEDAVSLTFHDRRDVWEPPLYRPLMALFDLAVGTCLMQIGADVQLDQPLGERQVIDASTGEIVEIARRDEAATPAGGTAFQQRVRPKLDDLREALGWRLVDYQLDPTVLHLVVNGERSVVEDLLVDVLGDDAEAVRLRAEDD